MISLKSKHKQTFLVLLEKAPVLVFFFFETRPVVAVDACFTKDWLMKEAPTTTMCGNLVLPCFFSVSLFKERAKCSSSCSPVFICMIMYMCIEDSHYTTKMRSGESYRDCTKEAKCQQNHKGESEAKATSLKGNDRLLLDVYISKSEQSRFVCSCVHNLGVQVFSGTIAPQNAHLFFKHQRERKKTFFRRV